MMLSLVMLSALLSTPSANALTATDVAPAASERESPLLQIRWLPRAVQRWAEPITRAADAHGVPPELVAIVVLVESMGDSDARSPTGACGLMQLMPATAVAIATARGLEIPSKEALHDPALNLDFGAYHLASLIRDLLPAGIAADDDVGFVAAAYNGGINAALRWADGEAELSDETSKYRKLVVKLWSRRKSPSRD